MGLKFSLKATSPALYPEPIEVSPTSPFFSFFQNVGWTHVHGSYNARDPLILPEGSHLTCWEGSRPVVSAGIGASTFTETFTSALNFRNVEKVVEDAKLSLSLNLFMSSLFNIPLEVKFIWLITSLEVIITDTAVCNPLQKMVSNFMERIKEEARNYEKDSPEYSDFQSVLSRLENVKNKSTKTGLRKLVEGAYRADPNTARQHKILVLSCYDMRSDLLHNGRYNSDKLACACQALFPIVIDILRQRFQMIARGDATSFV